MPNLRMDLFGDEAPEEPVQAEQPHEEDTMVIPDPAQLTLMEMKPEWEKHWDEKMPEFNQRDLEPFSTVKVHFRNREDQRAFFLMLGESPSRTFSVWFPKKQWREGDMSRKAAPGTAVEPNKYPVYVISKGRADTRMTSKALEELGIDYRIVIEPQEFDQYSAVISPGKILTLPFSNLGQGSIPARNWVWDHALALGADKHWILDDNIGGWYRLLNNRKLRTTDENPFTPIEEFADKYENMMLAGPNYEYLCRRDSVVPPFVLNTRVYSCILINHKCQHRWRGRYNEDTDLSLRVLKDGDCTVLFNAVLCDKEPTMLMKGGNTDELYKGDGRLKMAESLRDQHPDVTTVIQKWGRWQHSVNYRPFRRNRLILRPELAEASSGTA